jgi:hypothetical protein
MHRNFMEPMVDAHYTVRDRGAHRLADQPPRHRIGIAIDLHRTIALHAPDQLARRVEGRNPGNQLESFGLGALESVDRRLAGRAMQAHIGDIPRPGFKMRLQGFPAREAAAGNRVPLHITDAVLRFAFGARAIRSAGARSKAPVLGKRLEPLIKHHRARRRIMLDH